MDELKRGPDEAGEPPPPPTDRDYWEKRGSKATVHLADEMLTLAREIDSTLEAQYNKHYIGIYKNGQPFNFTTFRPQKNAVNVAFKIPRSDEIDHKIEESGMEALSYSKWGTYRLSLQRDDILKHRDFLKQLMQAAYEIRSA